MRQRASYPWPGMSPRSSRWTQDRLRLLIDRCTLEVFGNDGAVALQSALNPVEGAATLAVFSRGDESRLCALDVYKLCSLWSSPP